MVAVADVTAAVAAGQRDLAAAAEVAWVVEETLICTKGKHFNTNNIESVVGTDQVVIGPSRALSLFSLSIPCTVSPEDMDLGNRAVASHGFGLVFQGMNVLNDIVLLRT